MARSSSLRLRLNLFAVVAVLATLALGGSAGAQITVGQTAPDLALVGETCASENGYNEVQTKVAAGAGYQAPVAGVLTSWSSLPKASGPLALGVYRPVAGQYLLAAADAPRVLAPGVLNTFPVAIPVQAGDFIGVVLPPGGNACPFMTGNSGDELIYRSGNAAVGSTLAFDPEDFESLRRLNISATLLPPPTIASLSPGKGSVKGAKVTIVGTNFASVSAVAFGSVAAKSFTVDSEGQITATAPASKKLAKVPVTVTTVAGTATSATTYAYEGCKVPNLAGKKLKASKKKASKADCKIGKVTKKDGATGKTGKVTKQNPKPGKLLAPGTKIKVTLEP